MNPQMMGMGMPNMFSMAGMNPNMMGMMGMFNPAMMQPQKKEITGKDGK